MLSSKSKKQFRLYDIYRCAVTGDESNVIGIYTYTVSSDATDMLITFTSGEQLTYIARNEEELRDVVREVNKILSNCDIPGPRKGTKYKKRRNKS